MMNIFKTLSAMTAGVVLTLTVSASAETVTTIPSSIITPDKVKSGGEISAFTAEL